MPTKYPPFDRITAGRLQPGDRILVRQRGSDSIELAGQDGIPFGVRAMLPAGEHVVARISSELRSGYRRSSRYYSIELEDGSAVFVSSVQRFNRVSAEVSS